MNETTRNAILALADAIEQDEVVINYKAAKENFDNDDTLSTKINEYTVQRMIFEKAAAKRSPQPNFRKILLKQISRRQR